MTFKEYWNNLVQKNPKLKLNDEDVIIKLSTTSFKSQLECAFNASNKSTYSEYKDDMWENFEKVFKSMDKVFTSSDTKISKIDVDVTNIGRKGMDIARDALNKTSDLLNSKEFKDVFDKKVKEEVDKKNESNAEIKIESPPKKSWFNFWRNDKK